MNVARKPWPAAHLEPVPNCPVCGSDKRRLRHEGLCDATFFTANGEWDLWQCDRCDSGWLDPRPDEASIGEAYGSYYTHGEVTQPIINNLRRKLANGYRNWRFGTSYSPALAVGAAVAMLMPAHRYIVDLGFRFLPRSRCVGGRVLDFGCGGGDYLQLVADAGWQGCGVEPDPKARELARSRGFDVRASLDEFKDETFDYVTLSHVIEHVHRPISALKQLHGMSASGGGLFIATPNMNAIGHEIYGRHWRGIETPRHLVLPTRRSLRAMTETAGYRRIEFHRSRGALAFTSLQSRRIASGADPYDHDAPLIDRQPTAAEMREADGRGKRAEFLIMTAFKP